MAHSILLADSGATKTAWRLLENGRNHTFYTSGISPYYMSKDDICQLIRKEFPKKVLSRSIDEIYYYGTGCKTSSKANVVFRAIKELFTKTTVHVTHDLMGAAIATCGRAKGIACILGTGSNSCYFNGSRIVSNSPGLGYLLGDEASGAYFGKSLVQHFLYKQLDDELEKAFVKSYRTDKDQILHNVYKEPFPNRYLAEFAKFLSAHRGHYIIENIIEDGLRLFMGTHLLHYPQSAKVPIHFVGSIAFHFKDKIVELCSVYGFTLGKIIKDPIEGLTQFHLEKSEEKRNKTTEAASHYRHLEKMSIGGILSNINKEDQVVPQAVSKAIFQITPLVECITDKMLAGGRLFYIGAGTSGRLGVVDASECPPTYGIPHGMVIGIIAGGRNAMFNAVEFAEDDVEQAWKDLQAHDISQQDVVVGIAASGSTPYVIGGLRRCRQEGISTGSISCNFNAATSREADFPVEVEVGPEFVTGSTRMKSGTAQKLILNMISTAVMIQLGRVEDNKMVNMQLTNEKLIARGTHMLMEKINLNSVDEAKSLLLKHGSVKKAMDMWLKDNHA